jgi:hypothetical protein
MYFMRTILFNILGRQDPRTEPGAPPLAERTIFSIHPSLHLLQHLSRLRSCSCEPACTGPQLHAAVEPLEHGLQLFK